MVRDQFHGRPFDEGTLTKLQIFELYAREWLPVFLARADPPKREIHVFDFFAGPGVDSKGELGTPLRLLRQLAGVQGFQGWVHTNVHAHFYDSDPEKIEKLKSAIAAQGPTISRLTLDLDTVEFGEALRRSAAVLGDPNAAKLLLVDQFGVDNVTPDVFRVMVDSPTCDFLFFLSSSTLHRFRELKHSVAAELLEVLSQVSPQYFETIVLDLLHRMGYGASRADLQRVGGVGDGGIDGVISLDRLGLESFGPSISTILSTDLANSSA
jgi:three-Cys-motif partner protein